MLFLLSFFKYETFGQRTFDWVIFFIRRIIWAFTLILGIIFSITLYLTFSHKSLDFSTFFWYFLLLIACIFGSLYFGLWHTKLTSRQRFKLFNKREDLVENERVKVIKRYIAFSFFNAVFGSIVLIWLSINILAMATLNQMFVGAEAQLKSGTLPFDYHTLSPLIGNTFWNTILLIAPVFYFGFLIYNSYNRDIVPYARLTEVWLKDRFFDHKNLAKLLSDTNSKGDAILKLGQNSDTGGEVVMKTDSRRLHTAAFGPIGSGKSVSFLKPFIIQDAANVAVYLREYAKFVADEKEKLARLDFDDELAYKEAEEEALERWYTDGLGKTYINGFYVNEPSGELIGDALEIIERTGFPRDMIWNVDPVKEDTEAINIFDADTDTVAGLISNLIRSFSGEGNNFFQAAEQAYVRYLTVMLKVTSRIENSYLDKHLNGGAPTLSDFYALLEEPGLVIKRLKLFKAYRDAYERSFEEEVYKPYQERYEREKEAYIASGGIPGRFEANMSLELRKSSNKVRDERNKVQKIIQAYNYFANSYQEDPKTGVAYITHEANIQGMKNIFRKLSSSVLVRRIFFSPSTKNIDIFLKTGGFLLINTARGPVDDDSSQMVSQITDLIVQQAVFRRSPKTTDPFFTLYGDEKGWGITSEYERYLNQSRKYNVASIDAYQNKEQIEATIGGEYTQALLNSYRNMFVFQGGSPNSNEMIVERASEELKLSMAINKGKFDLLAGNDNNSTSIREELKEESTVSSSELFRMEKFQYAGIMVVDDEMSKLIKVTPKPAFKWPIFKDWNGNYKPPFDVANNTEDAFAYQTWKEQNERYYIARQSEGIIPFDYFTKKEKDIILGIDSEEDTEEVVAKKPISPKKEQSQNLGAKDANKMADKIIKSTNDPKELFGGVESTSKQKVKEEEEQDEKVDLIQNQAHEDEHTVRQGNVEKEDDHIFNPLL